MSKKPLFLQTYEKASLHLSTFPWKSLSGELEPLRETLEALRVSAFQLQSLGRILELSSRKDRELTEIGAQLRLGQSS